MCAFAPRDASFIKARDVIAAACPLPENDIICLSPSAGWDASLYQR